MALDGKQGDMGNLHSLTLDEDEIEHLTKIEPEVSRMLQLANRGAKLSLDGIADGCKFKTSKVGSSASTYLLFLIKAADLIKLAVKAISFGYYPGCIVLLRSAFETVAYLFLFIEDPDEIKLWLRFQLHSTLDPVLKKPMKTVEREQLERAKIKFLNQMPGQIPTQDGVAASCLDHDAAILSSMSLLLSHRIADLVFLSPYVFRVWNAKLIKDFEKWHEDVKKGG